MRNLIAAVARFTAHRWWAVVAVWLVATAGLLLVAPPFQQVATFSEADFLGEDADPIQGGQLLAEGWPDSNFTRNGAVVLERRGQPLTPEDRTYAETLAGWFESQEAPEVFGDVTSPFDDERLASSFVADDGEAMFFLVGLEVSPFSPPARDAVEAAREHIGASASPEGLEVHLTGTAGVAADESAAIDASIGRTHIITLLLIAGILLLVYRSPVAPLVPLATIIVSFAVSISVVSLLADAGMTVFSLYESFAIVIVFGAGTDYCLFLISRYKEELDRGREAGLGEDRGFRGHTLTATLIVLAAVIGSSALTTIAGFSAQSISDFGMYRSMGPAMAISIAITLLAALTLAPALMRMLGRALFWPHRYEIALDHAPGNDPLVRTLADHLEGRR